MDLKVPIVSADTLLIPVAITLLLELEGWSCWNYINWWIKINLSKLFLVSFFPILWKTSVGCTEWICLFTAWKSKYSSSYREGGNIIAVLFTKVYVWNYQILVTAIFLKQDMWRNFLPIFIEIYKSTPCWCPSGWAPTWRPETNKSICHWVLIFF